MYILFNSINFDTRRYTVYELHIVKTGRNSQFFVVFFKGLYNYKNWVVNKIICLTKLHV